LTTSLLLALITVPALVLVTRRLTVVNWPLAHAGPWLVLTPACCCFSSFVLRARGWRRLFPYELRPEHARCPGSAPSPTTALSVLCLGAAAGVLPITAGGAFATVEAATASLLALAADKGLAINFALASGLLLVTTAIAGVACSPVARAFAQQPFAARRPRPGTS
jgi:hypothetical protein